MGDVDNPVKRVERFVNLDRTSERIRVAVASQTA